MEYSNYTPFSTLAFQSLDQHGEEFHVVVMRAILDIREDGVLQFSDEQTPIACKDEYFGEMNKSSLRQESDLAPFKPKCDVIVNATAHSPGGKPAHGFITGIRVAGRPGLEAEGQRPVLEKRLVVTGPRYWERSLTGWRITRPVEPIVSLPLRYEYAFGGECRINGNDSSATRLDPKYLLSPDQCRQHPDGPDNAPAAHTVCEANPVGIGYVEPWHLKATRLKKIRAPQIDSGDDPISEISGTYPPQGFGAVTRTWQPRLGLAGTYDHDWLNEKWPKPPDDFDSSYWNAAASDMQVPYLNGDERIELLNMCPFDTPGVSQDPHGNTVLSFELPGYTPYVLIDYGEGVQVPGKACLDTLVINTDDKQVVLVWRACIPCVPLVEQIAAGTLLKHQKKAREGLLKLQEAWYGES